MSVMTSRPEALEPLPMARKPANPANTVRLDIDLVRKVAYICLMRNVSAAQYLSPMVRDRIEADYAEELDKQNREFRQSKKKP